MKVLNKPNKKISQCMRKASIKGVNPKIKNASESQRHGLSAGKRNARANPAIHKALAM